ncbi:MAG TPA: acetyltransferase [Chthoniobacterales bacterium]|jgi:sugar O-acyltransferase (sialic acid O-acetyltransferase NeuD family)|nr:acetyltransferase [Chthoniobacterales bacterium]
MEKKDKLLIIGDSAFAEIAFEYFQHDSPYEVVAFCVEREFLKRESLFGLPVVPMEEMEERYPAAEHSFYAANVYTQGNQLRTRLYQAAKDKGYKAASYISPRAFVWRNCKIGEHCFIFENNVVQPFVTIGDNVVLWSGNHIGHHSKIGSNCFISSHVVVSGFCEIGEACFMGVNSTVSNNTKIGDNCVVGASALVLSEVGDNQTAVGIWKKKQA